MNDIYTINFQLDCQKTLNKRLKDYKAKVIELIDNCFDFDHTKKFKPSLDRDKCKFCKLKNKIKQKLEQWK